jgi:hypothetical protein
VSDDKDLEVLRLKRMLAEQSLEILLGYSRVAEYVRIREEHERLSRQIAQREALKGKKPK